MSIMMQKLFRVVLEQEMGGEGSAGGTTVDRGDFLPEAKTAPEPEPKEEEKAAEPEPEEEKAPEEPAEQEETEEDKHPKDKQTGKFEAKIPKSRFDEAVGKEREAREAAERRAAALEQQLRESAAQAKNTEQIEAMEAEVSQLEEQHAQLLLDGDVKKAAEVMKQIRHAERQIAKAEVTAETKQITSQALETERTNLVIAQLEAKYPQLNEQSEEFDERLVNFVLSEQQRLMRQGFSRDSALQKATVDIMDVYGKKAEPAKEEKGLGKAAAADRKAEQVKKNLDTQKSQPASTKDVGLDSDKLGDKALPDITKMTQDEFNALPESTKARLRGDIL